MKNFVKYERHGHTAVITLNRPDRRNALDQDVRNQLAESIFMARDESDVRAVVLTGAGGVFCAGGDLKDVSTGKRTVFGDRERIRRLQVWFRELVNMEKPVIAAVDGAAFGAGFNLALACDFVIATPEARFCMAFGRLGLVPDLGGFFLLPRIVGLQRAKDLIFTSREVSAEEGQELGLVYDIVAQEALFDRALNMAERFHHASTEAIGLSKNILNRSFNLDQEALSELEAGAQAVARNTEYYDAAVQRFLKKERGSFIWEDDRGQE